ncbi:hypothetical protein KR067_001458, partial [Drosophila pandora]
MPSVLIICLLFGIVGGSPGMAEFDKNNSNVYHRLDRFRNWPREFFAYYQNVTVAYLVPENRLVTTKDLQCYEEFSQLVAGPSSENLWALKMIDSWGSIPSGILMGHLMDLGHYDECIRINQVLDSGHNLLGKYCLAQLPLHQWLGYSEALSLILPQTGVCFPASCSYENMDALLGGFFQQIPGIEFDKNMTLIKEGTCKTSEKVSLDGLAIFTIVLLSTFGAAVAFSTLYDYFLCEDQMKLPAVLKVFSARTNSRSLFRLNTKPNPNVIECLNGIRCLSLIWVCFGHEYRLIFTSPLFNYVDVYSWAKKPFMMFINQGVFAVDTFFFLSGLLVALLSLRTMERSKGKLHVPLMYLHRFLRVTPMLVVAIIVYMKLLPLVGDGPLYGKWNFDNYDSCKKNWFWTLLYIQNYAADEECLAHAWYLAIDMQLYILSPIFIFAVYKWGKKGAAGVFGLILGLAGFLFGYMAINEYSLLNLNVEGSEEITHHTHNRASGWLVGFLFGYFLHTNRGKSFKLNRVTVWIGWITSLALFFTVIFAMYPYGIVKKTTIGVISEAFYVSLSRIAWPLGLSWVVFACMQGYGGLANSILSSPLWQPLSKLSFSVYIWHLFIQNLNMGRTRVNTYFSDYDVVCISISILIGLFLKITFIFHLKMLHFWQDFGFSLLLAYVMYILIEAPCGGLESILLPNRRPRDPTNIPPPEVPTAKESESQ